MSSPVSPAEFLNLIQRSKLINPSELGSYLQRLKSANAVPAKAEQFAGLLVRDGFLTRYQAEQLLRGKWQRFTLGRYRILGRIGSGGMGSVFLCEHTHMHRRVAVKVLPASQSKDQAALERFYREARAVAALDHRNIIRAYDIDADHDLHFLAMEYVEGANLQQIVTKSGPLSPDKAANYLCQTAQGLEHAFRAGLIHRDIKPANLLVDNAGVIKILDLGLARFFGNEKDDLTQRFSESILGTADYMSPEQALDSHAVDIRADIYSLGATFYFCLAGQQPFQGTMAEKVLARQTRSPKPLSEVRPEIPEFLSRIIDRMMATNPEDRYQTPLKVAAAVQARNNETQDTVADQPATVQEPITNKAWSKLQKAEKSPRRRWAVLLLVAGILVLLTIGVGWFVLRDKAEVASAVPTSRPSERAIPKPPTVNFSKGFAGTMSITHNGSAHTIAATGELRLSDNKGQAGSAFYTERVNVSKFTTSFDFRLSQAKADGFTFTIQAVNSSALGGAGAGLGYGGIQRSVCVKFDLWDNQGEGPNSTGVFTNGQVPTVKGISPLKDKDDLRGTGIDLHSGHLFTADLRYDGITLVSKITDQDTKATVTRSYKVNFSEAVGDQTAWVGFTAATGGALAIQDILSWTFTSDP